MSEMDWNTCLLAKGTVIVVRSSLCGMQEKRENYTGKKQENSAWVAVERGEELATRWKSNRS